jgi:hypothetical protein
MPTLIAGVVAIVVLYSALQMFRAANPAVLARAIKIGGGVLALAVAAFTGVRGELAVAIPLGIFGAGLLGWSPFGNTGFPNFGGMFGGSRSAGQSSRVRSQYLDMSLDHGSGVLSGQIVAGPQAGRMLDEFDLSQLLAMVPSFDAESVALLESYLDRRFPAWRQDAQGDRAGGLSDPWPAAGRVARRHQPGSPHLDEETPSRPGGLDVPRGPCERGQGYSASHASLTPATRTTPQPRAAFRL